MAVAVVMPRLSDTMTEGRILKWKKREGDRVQSGEVLAEVETDKATMDLEAYDSGSLLEIFALEGELVKVGANVAVIGKPGEDVSAFAPAAPLAPSVPPPLPVPGPPAEAARPAPAAPGRVKASPLARRIARERGIPLESLRGSGPGGRVVRRDVEVAAPAPSFAPLRPPPAAVLPLSLMRKTVGLRMAQSKREVPHFYLSMEVDMERAVELRVQLKELGQQVSLNDLLIKAAAVALARVPEVNAYLEGESIRRLGTLDVGMAVAIEEGLLTPVIRDAGRKNLLEIARESKELAERARVKRLKPEEYAGGGVTVSNLGMFGVDSFYAIVNPPQAAIIATGTVAERPCVVGGQLAIRKRMWANLSGDHRIIDGAVGARFLSELKKALELPIVLTM